MRFLASVWVATLSSATLFFSVPSYAAGCGSQDKLPTEQRLFNTLTWVTKSEVESKFFDVLRGDAKEGPFAKINPEPIKAAHYSGKPKTYTYADSSIDPCKTYYYFIIAEGTQGNREQVSAVHEAHPKLGQDGKLLPKAEAKPAAAPPAETSAAEPSK